MGRDREIVKYVIGRLESLGKKTDKIVVQKLVFYLAETGVPIGYTFEPHLYGPYSQELSDDASDLSFWEQIEEDYGKYRKGTRFNVTLPEKLEKRTQRGIDGFLQVVGGDLSFNSMELFGTVLYCIKALEENGMDTNLESVLEEFEEWKGDKYDEDQVGEMYHSILSST